jgi:malonyl-CoA O-methyltransferase
MHYGHHRPYPEVTGYWVPTLLSYGERQYAARLAQWLVSVQNADGSFSGHNPADGVYVFDTGQILRGLLATMDMVPEARDAALRAADYICSQMIDEGAGGFVKRYDDNGDIPESIQLYVLPPLIRAGAVFERPKYVEMAARCTNYYLRQPYTLHLGTLTHFLGYELEALIELGRTEAAAPVLQQLRELQLRDGSVRAEAAANWVCTTGLAQIAVCWYRLEWWESADRAMEWLDQHQLPKGGLLGSYGPGANYWPEHEPVWGVKYYLDAHRLRVQAYWEHHLHDAGLYTPSVAVTDGRVQALAQALSPGDAVVEVGCGNGRMLRALQAIHPDLPYTGVDISPKVLAMVPDGVQTLVGSLETVPCPSDHFAVAFAVEVIEQVANLEASVAELIRVTRPGGQVIIIGKPQHRWGWTSCPPWERWPDGEYIRLLLEMGCDSVCVSAVSFADQPADGRMVMWCGTKRRT